ncbi:putative ribonuclease H-like domain-containing protein [Tanacetum coccineum]
MYSLDMKNIVPKVSLTYLVAKATSDESMLWHMRLGHINFKNINKLVKDNLEKGLPTKLIDDFCREKGIKREYNVARTPQQNGMADWRNKTLTEAARTISKAFKVYNTRTRRVKENLHIGFLENKTMIEGNGPKWLFDIDSLTQSMNYAPVAAGTITNEFADASYFDSPSKDVGNGEPKSAADDQKQVEDGQDNENDEKDNLEVNTSRFKLSTVDPSINTASSYDPDSHKDMFKMGASHTLEATHVGFLSDKDEPEVDLGNILNSYTVPTTPNIRIHKDHPIKNVIGDVKSSVQTRRMTKPTSEQGFLSAVEAMQEELLQFKLQQVWKLMDLPNGKRAIGTKWVFRNKKDERGIVIRNKARLVAKGHSQEEDIDYEEVFALVARIEAIRLFLAYASFMGFLVYQIDVKSAFLYRTIEEEVYVTQPPAFKDPNHPDKVYKVYVDDIIFGSTNKELCTAFEKLMKDKFQMSSMGELTFFLGLQCKKQTVVATSTTEAEYVAVASCCG